MKLILLIVPLVSFLVTLLLTPYWIRRAKKAGLVGRDMNKYRGENVAEIGGVTVVAGFLAAMLIYIALKTFYFPQIDSSVNPNEFIIEVLAVIATILLITLMGFIDGILGWRIGLKQYEKPLFCLIAAIPLAVINAGESAITLPFLGRIDIGLLYPLLLVPMGISGSANGFNMLAGYNGLEAGMGIIILTTLGIITLQTEQIVALIAFAGVAALIAFFIYNKYPAKVFPGDVMTYSTGALIAIVAILGNAERAAIILFLPYFAELVLKLRGKLKKQSFALAKKDNSLDAKEIYSIPHIVIRLLRKYSPKKKAYEEHVVAGILLLEIVLAGIALLLY